MLEILQFWKTRGRVWLDVCVCVVVDTGLRRVRKTKLSLRLGDTLNESSTHACNF